MSVRDSDIQGAKAPASQYDIGGEKLNKETAEDLKRWLQRGGVEVNGKDSTEETVRAQLANRSRRDSA